MKKFLASLVAISLVVLAGCGGGGASQSPSQSVSDSDSNSSSALPTGPKIGIVQIVEHPSLDEIRIAFAAELAAQGYEDIVVDYQNAQGEMSNVNSICQKFVGDGVDLIVAIATPSAQGAAAAVRGTNIPVLFSAVTDPVAAQLVADLNKPDGNITGTSDAIPVDRIFGLAKELTPNAKRFGFIYNLSEVNSMSVIAQAKFYCDQNGLSYQEATVTNSNEVQQAAQSLVGKVDAIFVPIDNTVATAMPILAQVAIDAKIPVYTGADSMVNDGGLATVGVNYTNLGKQTGEMAAKILQGFPISQMPVQVLNDMNVYVNPETAAKLGINVSKYAQPAPAN